MIEFFLEPLMLIVVVGASSRKLYSRSDAGATTSSQNAAALLIDLGTVDIRRVGTHCSEYSKWGVPSKIIGRPCAHRATMSHAQV
jgi:hypothetical protein